jgi:Leucyl/phenylalanyl-tRNA protein transferase
VWNCDGALVGGGYGVAVGGAFTVESQFTRESHTSKIGFAVLNWHLAHWGFQLNDNKGPTPHLLEMGFRIVPRRQFQTLLAQAAQVPGRPGRWSVEADLQTVAEWQPDVSKAGPRDAAEPSLDTPCDSKVGRLASLVPAIMFSTASSWVCRTPWRCCSNRPRLRLPRQNRDVEPVGVGPPRCHQQPLVG